MKYLLLVLLPALVILSARRIGETAGFSGSGFFFSKSAHCLDIGTPVTGQSLCWDVVNATFNAWNGTAWIPASRSIWMGGEASNATSSSANYFAVQGQSVPVTTENAYIQMVVPVAGYVSNLFCAAAGASGPPNLALRKNGATTGLTCPMTGSTCSDNAHIVNVAAGDLVDFIKDGSGTLNSILCSVSFVASAL